MNIELLKFPLENIAEYQLQLYKMTQISALEINKQIRLKYQHQFFLHFSNLVSELIYDNIHTANRAQSKDTLTFISKEQTLLYYFTNQEGEDYYRQAIQESARFFDAPQRIVFELPLMILTDTKDIFMRRRRKLRKMVNKSDSQPSLQNNSGSRSDFSSSTIAFLGNDISDLTGMLQSSSRSSLYSSSYFNCYKNSSLLKERSQIINLQNKQSGRLKIKKMVQFQLKHLIVEFHSQQSSQTHESKQKVKSSIESEQMKGTALNPSNLEIQLAIRAELKRYKIAPIPQTSSLEGSSIVSRSKLRVRQKAIQLLRNLRHDTIF